MAGRRRSAAHHLLNSLARSGIPLRAGYRRRRRPRSYYYRKRRPYYRKGFWDVAKNIGKNIALPAAQKFLCK